MRRTCRGFSSASAGGIDAGSWSGFMGSYGW